MAGKFVVFKIHEAKSQTPLEMFLETMDEAAEFFRERSGDGDFVPSISGCHCTSFYRWRPPIGRQVELCSQWGSWNWRDDNWAVFLASQLFLHIFTKRTLLIRRYIPLNPHDISLYTIKSPLQQCRRENWADRSRIAWVWFESCIMASMAMLVYSNYIPLLMMIFHDIPTYPYIYIDVYIWLVVWNIFYFSIYWE